MQFKIKDNIHFKFHTFIYVCVCMNMCVCVCVCELPGVMKGVDKLLMSDE